MKYLKTYKLFESIDDTKKEIISIISTCKDIMLEADDTFGESKVESKYVNDKVIISCLYKIPSRKHTREYKPVMDDVHERLIEYMTSQGFSYTDKGEGSNKYIDMLTGDIQGPAYNIAFYKELDKEFNAHIRYLRRYRLPTDFN